MEKLTLDLPPSSSFHNEVAMRLVNSNSQVKTFDLFTIWMVIRIIWEVIKCYIKKNIADEKGVSVAQKPNFIHRFLLKRLINKVVAENKHRVIGSGPSNKFYDELYNQMLELGKTGKVDDLVKLKAEHKMIGKIFGEN